MGEQEWLEHGHGSGDALLPLIDGSIIDANQRVSIAKVLHPVEAASRRRSRRRNKALVGWLLYSSMAVGGTAAAWTVRETLFPSLGAPTAQSVWANPGTDTNSSNPAAAPAHSIGAVDSSLDVTTTPATASDSPESSIKQGSSGSGPGAGPSDSTDKGGAGSGAGGNTGSTSGPQTGTTIANEVRSGGPVTTVGVNSPGGDPATTVDSHGAGGPGTTLAKQDTSSSTASSPVSPPSSADPQTSVSTPEPVTVATLPNNQSGGGGGGGGGGGNGGGPGPATTVP